MATKVQLARLANLIIEKEILIEHPPQEEPELTQLIERSISKIQRFGKSSRPTRVQAMVVYDCVQMFYDQNMGEENGQYEWIKATIHELMLEYDLDVTSPAKMYIIESINTRRHFIFEEATYKRCVAVHGEDACHSLDLLRIDKRKTKNIEEKSYEALEHIYLDHLELVE